MALQHDVIAVGLANGRIAARTEMGGRNRLLYAADFTNAAWVKTNITVTGNTTTDPYNTATADKLAESTTSSVVHSVRQAAALLDDLPYTWSVSVSTPARRHR